jgi:hypothetical protein
MNRPYTWVVHLNLNDVLPPAAIANWWPKVCRKLNDRGIACLWVREANRLNKCHYHIIVKSVISWEALAQAIEESMPARSIVKWRKRIESIKKEWRLAHYVVKAKVVGWNKHGFFVNDLYSHKRLLFKPKMPFKKIGTIGDFWEPGKTKKVLWDEIKAIEKQIAEGLEKPYIRRLAQYVHDLIGGYYTLKHVERAFGYDADDPVVQGWIESLLAGEWAEEDGKNAPGMAR